LRLCTNTAEPMLIKWVKKISNAEHIHCYLSQLALLVCGMTHNNEVTREAAGLNAICYLIPLGFTTLSQSCQICLTLINACRNQVYYLTHNSHTCSNMHCSCILTPITWKGLSLSFVADYIRTYEQFDTERVCVYVQTRLNPC